MMNAMCKKYSWCSADLGLLVLRIGVGLIFIITGWLKVSDLTATVGQFSQMGFAPFWAYLVSFVELIGGVALLLGIYTRIAAGLLAIVMLVASYKLFPNLPPSEFFPSADYLLKGIQLAMTPLAIFFSTLALSLAGGGKYSPMKGCCGGACSGGACGAGKSCGCEGVCNCGGGTCGNVPAGR